ncbi:nuclease-related domain-containing protein [Salirhabdus sp. Marseille-P4669]|uniref:nuclease-related domain-containing protein n=1 Tax=Salirhabdus sp. Marseille-P4669 TaxID=2042310 RepID=UPI0013586F91|nr:nuclease-related domain-containing protein [Salirhabdus sp. Marseille-P4669]
MIVKERPIPLSIKMHEALVRRVDPNHISMREIHKNLTQSRKGFRGETAIDYFLSYLPDKDYYILHDLTLSNKHTFQMDTLILTPYFFLILEVKNYNGTVYFDDTFKQLIRMVDGKKEGYPYPITQVGRHKKQLHQWLLKKGIRSIPIETLIVFSFSSTIIESSNHNPEFVQRIIHSENIPEAVAEVSKRYGRRLFTKAELLKLAKQMWKQDRPQATNLLEAYALRELDIRGGVHCPNCSQLPMNRKGKVWTCKQCNFSSTDAHVESLKDYAYLIGPKITNEQLRAFLKIPSPSTAAYILQSMNLPYTGKTKGRQYQLPL